MSSSPALTDPVQLARFLEAQLPAALDLLRRMVETNSWTGNRDGVERVARLTADAFAPLGFVSVQIPASNPAHARHLFLTRPGDSAHSVAMITHLDTVFPPEEEARNSFRWQPEGNRIFGPGTHDIKGGTVMMWLVLSALKELAPAALQSVNWQLCCNSSEEVLALDFGALCRKRFDRETLAALVFEAGGRRAGIGRLVVARKGRGTWRVTVTGRAAHAGARHAHGASAITQLGKTVQQIAGLSDPAQDLTFNVGLVSGGSGLNRVPHEAIAEGEFRAFTPAAYAAGKSALLALAGPGDVHSPVDGFTCTVQVEITSENAPWPPNPGTASLFDLWREAAASLGTGLEAEHRGGLSDGNFLWDVVPTLDGLGPAGDNDHCSERSADGSKLPEYVEIDSFVPKATLNTLAILKLIGTSGAPESRG